LAHVSVKADISGRNWSDLRGNFLTNVYLDKKPIQIRTQDPDLGSGPDLPWRRSAYSECSCLALFYD